MNADDGFVYVFLHVPRTGGSTLTGHLALHLDLDRELVQIGRASNRRREEAGLPHPADWPLDRRRGIRVLIGHGTDARSGEIAAGRRPRLMTLLRDPAAWMVSRYNFHASRDEGEAGFWDWYGRRKPNEMHRRMRRLLGTESHRDMTGALRDFWFVGVTEHLDDDLPHVFEEIGVPGGWTNRRVTGGGRDVAGLPLAAKDFAIEAKVSLTDEIRDRVHEDHPRDVRLHRLAGEIRTEHRARLGWD